MLSLKAVAILMGRLCHVVVISPSISDLERFLSQLPELVTQREVISANTALNHEPVINDRVFSTVGFFTPNNRRRSLHLSTAKLHAISSVRSGIKEPDAADELLN